MKTNNKPDTVAGLKRATLKKVARNVLEGSNSYVNPGLH